MVENEEKDEERVRSRCWRREKRKWRWRRG
jgi:hypothetical protein